MSDKKTDGQGDDFWDLSAYRKKSCTPKPSRIFSDSSISASDITIPVNNSNINVSVEVFHDQRLGFSHPDSEKNKVFSEHTALKETADQKGTVKPIIEYEPENIIIKKVQVFPSKNGRIFDNSILFLRERNAILQRKGKPCSYAEYYSVFPRYSQLSRAQLEWYLWWRECIRNGKFLETSLSYIILYIQELVVDEENPEKSMQLLCELLRLIDKNDSVMFIKLNRLITDFCIYHGFEIPMEFIADDSTGLSSLGSCAEFYLGLSEKNRHSYANIAQKYVSIYNYKKSKFYIDEYRQLFDTHISGSLQAMLDSDTAFQAIKAIVTSKYPIITTERNMFNGRTDLICKGVKIKIEAFPFASLQGIITDCIRYSENKIREHVGIKSRLSMLPMDKDIKNTLDAYFACMLPKKAASGKSKPKVEEHNEYDKFYDLPHHEFSVDEALGIEKESWGTTKILIESFTDGLQPDTAGKGLSKGNENIPEPSSEMSSEMPSDKLQANQTAEVEKSDNPSDESNMLKKSLGDLYAFVLLCIDGSAREQRSFALGKGSNTDEIADRINEIACEILGDIILEDRDGSYRIIEDYISIFEKG